MQGETMESSSLTLASLQAIHPGAFLLDVQQVAKIMGLSAKTIRNLGSRFVVPSIKIGDSRRYKIVDVAAVIDAAASGSLLAAPQLPVLAGSEKRGRGRPRKVAAREVVA